MRIYFASMLVTVVSSFLLGSFVLYKNPKSRVNQMWFLTSLSVCTWSFFIALIISASSETKALAYGKLLNFAASMIPVFFMHFCIAISHLSGRKNPILKYGYFSSGFILISTFTDQFCGVQPFLAFNYFVYPKIFFHYFTLHFFFFAIYAEFLLVRYLSKCVDHEKDQIKYIIFATTCGYIGGCNTFLTAYGFPIQPFLAHFVWLYAAIISYAIVKHRVMNIEIILRKGLVYSFLIGIITSSYFALVYLMGMNVQKALPSNSLPSALFTFTIIALCFKPLERKTQELADRFIFRKSPATLDRENTRLLAEVQNQDRMKAVATLAAGMAHEIKNPLTAIKTFTEHLPKNADNKEFVDKYTKLVSSEVGKIDGIVRQVLEFSKPDPLRLERLDVRDVLNQTLDLLGGEFVNYRIQVDRQLGTVPLLVNGDHKQLKQAFLNLLLNSIQAMPNGGKVSVSGAQMNGQGVQISISDTGCGISGKDLPHIFDPFYTTKKSGTGLGLSIVHGIIKGHGGKIEVDTDINSGTVFRVNFQ